MKSFPSGLATAHWSSDTQLKTLTLVLVKEDC